MDYVDFLTGRDDMSVKTRGQNKLLNPFGVYPPTAKSMPPKKLTKTYAFGESVSKTVKFADDATKSLMCGCTGNFFSEIIPASSCEFFTENGNSNHTVPYTFTTTNFEDNFEKSFWPAYNYAAFSLKKQYSTNFCLGIYQKHHRNCFREYTRYTCSDVSKLTEVFYTRKAVSNVDRHMCMCTNLHYMCFKCVQATLELHIMKCPKISEVLTVQVMYKSDFATSNGFIQNKYFTARGLIERSLSVLSKCNVVTERPFTVKYYFDSDLIHKEVGTSPQALTQSYCLHCLQPGNGTKVFICQMCTQSDNLLLL